MLFTYFFYIYSAWPALAVFIYVCVCMWDWLRKLELHSPQLNHEGKCEFMIIPCPSCKEHIRFNEQERHNERECPERTLNCKYCKEPFHFKNIKVGHDLFRLARMLAGLSGPRRRAVAALNAPLTSFFFAGARRDLSQVPDDLWRLREEENTPRKGTSDI